MPRLIGHHSLVIGHFFGSGVGRCSRGIWVGRAGRSPRSATGCGAWRDGAGSDDSESLESLHRSIELGCNFFDTAWGYGKGHSESILGRVVREHPGKKLIVATKIPPKNFTWPSRRGFTLDDCFPPEHIREYAEKSLANLGLPRIDLLQFHVWEDAWADDERWQRAMADLKDEGLIRAVGISVNRWEPENVFEDASRPAWSTPSR